MVPLPRARRRRLSERHARRANAQAPAHGWSAASRRTKGNLKAVQKLLGHKSMQTTGDVYTDWDLYQLADVLSALEVEE